MKKNVLLNLVPLIALGFGLVFSNAATAGHGYVSIPAAAFQPSDYRYQYLNGGVYISNYNGSSPDSIAPVQLPHGVTVTKLTFFFYDNSSAVNDWGSVTLYQNNNNGSGSDMAYASTNNSGNSSSYDDSIDYASIDNSQYSYFLELHLNSSSVFAYAVIIEYTNPVSLPLILR